MAWHNFYKKIWKWGELVKSFDVRVIDCGRSYRIPVGEFGKLTPETTGMQLTLRNNVEDADWS